MARAAEPGHGDANHNLGVLLAIQLLRPQEALPYFEAALNAGARGPRERAPLVRVFYLDAPIGRPDSVALAAACTFTLTP